MKTLLRLAFVSLILLGLAAQAMRIRRADAGTDGTAALAASLETMGLHSGTPDDAGVLRATTSGCALPITIGLFTLDGGEDERARDLLGLGPATLPRYVYLGFVGSRPDRLRMDARWALASLRAALGLRAVRAPSHIVVAALPIACPTLAQLDWAAVSPWD